MGRKKIEMKMVKDSSSRQVTFSKRRSGVFKKANDLSTLCGAEIAIIVFSPGNKPYSFGNPSVDSVIDRFLNEQVDDDDHDDEEEEDEEAEESPRPIPQRNLEVETVEQLNKQLDDVHKNLEKEKKRGVKLQMKIGSNQQKLFKKPFNDLDYEELLAMKNSLEELKKDVNLKIAEMEASSSLLLLSQGAPHHNN